MIVDALHEAIINKHTDIEKEIEDNIIKQSTQNASFAKMIRFNEIESIISWTNSKCDKIEFPYPNLEEFLYEKYQLDEITFCKEHGGDNVRYRCHQIFCINGHYYDWILVKYDDGNNFHCKIIAIIPGEYNKFEGYRVIIQEAKKKLESGFVLFVDYKFSPKLITIDADTVKGPCFVIERDS